MISPERVNDGMSTTTHRVSRRDHVKGGRPTVRDSKLSVVQLVRLVRETGLTPREVVDRYPDVDDVDAVRDALAWAEENQRRVEQLREQRELAHDALERLASNR